MNMITKFEQYKLFETSNLTKLFKLDKEDLNKIYKHFNIKNDEEIIKLNINDLVDFYDEYNKNKKDYVYIIDFKYKQYFIKEYFYTYGDNDIHVYNTEHNNIENFQSNIENFLDYILNTENINNINFFKIKQYSKKEYSNNRDEMINLINDTIDLYYGNLFKKFYTSYNDMIKKMIKENIDSVEVFDTDEHVYQNQLFDDYNKSLELKDDYKIKINKQYIKRQLVYILKNEDEKKYDEHEWNLLDFYDDLKNNLYSVITKFAKRLFIFNNKELKIYQYKYLDILIEKDPSKWKDLKVNIYDKQLKDKFKYLNDAENFDLI